MDLTEIINVGEIQLIIGPMFSGKTSELIRRISRYSIAQKKCIIIKYVKDTLYPLTNENKQLRTHDYKIHEAVSTSLLNELDKSEIIKKYDIIGIDEGQFFEDLHSFTQTMCDVYGKIVIIAALSGTFQKKPWDSISNIIPLANKISFFKAVCCRCHKDGAAFTHRRSSEKEIQVIGGLEKYWPVGSKCYILFTKYDK